MSKITTERHYKITLTGGSTYYGRTTLPGDRRFYLHKKDARCGIHSSLQESYNKYGYDDWVHKWLSTETGDKQHHDKIEYGYVQADPKALNKNKGDWALLSKEQQGEKTRLLHQADRDKHTPEEREEYNRLQREYYHEVRARMTPEELKEFNKKECLKMKRRKENETPEQREKRLRRDREYYHRKKRGGDNKEVNNKVV